MLSDLTAGERQGRVQVRLSELQKRVREWTVLKITVFHTSTVAWLCNCISIVFIARGPRGPES